MVTKNSLNVGIKGFVTILSNKDGKVLEEHNAIDVINAPEILLRSLTNLDFDKTINSIRVEGNFGIFDKPISSAEYNGTGQSITFSTIMEEGDFDGTINKLSLRSTALGLNLANKENLSILKDSQSRILITWRISLTVTAVV